MYPLLHTHEGGSHTEKMPVLRQEIQPIPKR